MLKPKKIKFKKIQNNKNIKSYSYQSSICINFSSQRSIFLISKESGIITSIQLEIGKKLIQKILNKQGITLTVAFPQTPISRKPIGSRIGKGKGSVSFWVTKVNFGQKIYEIRGISNYNSLKKIKSNLSKKLPLKISIFFKYKTKSWF